jgi:hypothetical protein
LWRIAGIILLAALVVGLAEVVVIYIIAQRQAAARVKDRHTGFLICLLMPDGVLPAGPIVVVIDPGLSTELRNERSVSCNADTITDSPREWNA